MHLTISSYTQVGQNAYFIEYSESNDVSNDKSSERVGALSKIDQNNFKKNKQSNPDKVSLTWYYYD